MLNRWIFSGFVFLLMASMSMFSESMAQTSVTSQYGVCSHLGGGMEFDAMPQNLKAMRAAGIRWARADFSWSGVERGKGNWHFEHLDRVLDEAEKAGITVLPILNYDVPWASPAYKHLDEWSEYVRRVVTRYKDRIQYWEVWNEENLQGFWRDKPTGESYAILLKRTSEIIRSIDPNLKVVFGGLAGVPHSYYEDVLKAGAGDAFDVVNIHPYRGGMVTVGLSEQFISDIQKFRDLTVKYTGQDKPIWITEMGWATPPAYGDANREIVTAGLNKLYPNGLPGKFAAVYDTKYEASIQTPPVVLKSSIPCNVDIDYVTLEQLKTLSPKTHPFLLLPPGEQFPTPYFDDLVQYVRDGGTLILVGGVPLYYITELNSFGMLTQKHAAPNSYRDTLRIGWEAWWTKKNVPESTKLVPAPGFETSLKMVAQKSAGNRFLNDSLLKEGDEFIPLLNASDKEYHAPTAAVLKFNSDFKGAIIVSMIMNGGSTNVSSEPDQGVFLPQAYLLAFAGGVDRYFWYEFQAVEQDDIDKEHHFGMVHRDLSPKSGYLALKTLTAMRPDGSIQNPGWRNDDLCHVSWKRPDGKTVHALWLPGTEEERTVDFGTPIVSACNYLGKSVDIPAPNGTAYTFKLSPKITYFVTQ